MRRLSHQERQKQAPPLLPPTLLLSTDLDGSINDYRAHRITSRNHRPPGQSSIRPRPRVNLSALGDVFEAADNVFRSSIAFRRPSELTLPPRRREMHQIWRSSLMAKDYSEAKTERIRRNPYASNYKIEGMGEWYKGRPI
jgi:hypothetical protein